MLPSNMEVLFSVNMAKLHCICITNTTCGHIIALE